MKDVSKQHNRTQWVSIHAKSSWVHARMARCACLLAEAKCYLDISIQLWDLSWYLLWAVHRDMMQMYQCKMAQTHQWLWNIWCAHTHRFHKSYSLRKQNKTKGWMPIDCFIVQTSSQENKALCHSLMSLVCHLSYIHSIQKDSN